ncbi:MAG: hypothetical protein PHP01_00445 [Phycisphaerae bacterium]|nr:hypothetical protein [Phycisphaerae bacterium]
MDRQCDNCGQKNSCQAIYEKLGKSKSPSILLKVITAILLPLIFFIVTIAATEKIFSERITNSSGRNMLALVTAVAVVGLYLLILKLWSAKH